MIVMVGKESSEAPGALVVRRAGMWITLESNKSLPSTHIEPVDYVITLPKLSEKVVAYLRLIYMGPRSDRDLLAEASEIVKRTVRLAEQHYRNAQVRGDQVDVYRVKKLDHQIVIYDSYGDAILLVSGEDLRVDLIVAPFEMDTL